MNKKDAVCRTGMEIAVIGMAGRFPGAGNINEFWENLKNGVEAISRFTEEELMAEGVAPELIANPDYVKANGAIEGIEYFDSFFFGYSPEEAKIMNPQIRIFHECIWEALEDAGYSPDTYKGLIGLYAGAASSVEWEAAAYLSGKSAEVGQLAANSLADKDYLCSRTSYRLNLKGPSYSVNTACSTSLVSVHLACRALLTGDCNMALAGGINIMNQQKTGYLYEDGMVVSPDGHCRAFDDKSRGTVPGNGVGIVVLKLLKNAIADGDNIYAVVKGSAINNDGARKVGYAAPSIEGQSEVIRVAHRAAKIEPESISYIEAHGTGTVLGDPVEIAALKLAFRTEKKHFCAVGSVKTNVGHLDTAAGVTGFIKTVLALKHKQIPPSLHFESQNSRIDFENSPFYVNTSLKEWENDMYPLRAGVSSFGIGGTNAHVVLEEMAPEERIESGRKLKIISISAKTPDSLERMTSNLAGYFKSNPNVSMGDAAYTLHLGRQHFKYRRMLVCADAEEASGLLNSNSKRVQTFSLREGQRPVVMMFSGLGSQYVNMGLDLYREELDFRGEVDHCFDIFYKLKGIDVRETLYPLSDFDEAEKRLAEIGMAQIVTFIFEYALAKLLMKWGVKPQAMIGYSFGEYAAACLAGVFGLEDALGLVSYRGDLMQEVEDGAMLSVPLSQEEITPLIGDQLSIAVSNGPSCIVSGSCLEIAAFENKMKQRRLLCVRINTTRAVHSKMMEPVMEKLRDYVSRIKLNPPQIPFISNVTGSWIKREEATNPGYWAKHLRNTVRFDDGIRGLLKEEHAIFIEVGPGRDLSLLLERHLENRPECYSINLIRPQTRQMQDTLYLLNKIGHLWLYGVDINWKEFYSREQRRRISMPTYSFDKKLYKIQGSILKNGIDILERKQESGRKKDISEWFYQPLWQQSAIPPINAREDMLNTSWMVFARELDFDKKLVGRLGENASSVIVIKTGEGYRKLENDMYVINPGNEEDYETLFSSIMRSGRVPDNILHLWSADEAEHKEPEDLDVIQSKGLHSLLSIARTIGKLGILNEIKIKVIINNLQKVTGDEMVYPQKATIIGAVKIIPVEYMNISCSIIDMPIPDNAREERLLEQVCQEAAASTNDIIVAYRGSHRWVQVYQAVGISKADSIKGRLKAGGVYLILGGFGGMGYTMAEHLAEVYKAKLILVGRSAVPHRDKWDELLHSLPAEDSTCVRIRMILRLESLGAEVFACDADVSDLYRMKEVVSEAIEHFETINGVIHAAGVIDFGGVIQKRTRDITDAYMASKVQGTLVLEKVLEGMNLDFVALFSSFTNMVYTWKFGQVSYIAANEFLDYYSYHKKDSGTFTVTINWSDWQEVGMAIDTINQHYKKNSNSFYNEKFKKDYEEFLKESVKPSEAVDIFRRILANSYSHLIISPCDLNVLLGKQKRLKQELSVFEGENEHYESESFYPRPELATEYVSPEGEIEKELQGVFQRFFGIEEIGVVDDFFDLGGDSLKAMNMILKIHKKYRVAITLQKFFEAPTIRGIASILNNDNEICFTDIHPIQEAEYYKLTPMQRRLFVLDKLEESNTAYNMTRIMLSEGELCRERLEESLKLLIERHETLRTSFDFRGDEPVQLIHRFVDFKMDYFEMENNGSDAWIDKKISDILADFTRPFDLSQAPIFRVKLVKVNENKHIILLDMHHIISDGISMNLLERDISYIYNKKKLPNLRIQFKDFVDWQNKRYRTETARKQDEYWVQRLSEELPVLNMPLDFPRPSTQSFDGNSLNFQVDTELLQRLNKLAVQRGATLYMVLLAAYNILLSKYTGQEDIIVGSPVSGRVNEDTDNLIGLFINTLLMRNLPLNDMTFKEFLANVKKNSIEAYSNQEYQMDKLLEKIRYNIDLSRNPIFDTMFTLHSADIAGCETSDLKLRSMEINKTSSRFDFTLDIIEKDGRLDCSLEYCSRLFEMKTMQRFAAHYVNVLKEIVENPNCRLADLNILSEDEKRQLLNDFNNTKTDYPKDKTLNTLFEEQVERSPSAVALIFKDTSITYKELNERANRLARLLRQNGACAGSIIGLMVRRSIEMIVGLLGILKAGGAYLPLDFEYPPERIKYMIQDSNTKILLLEKELYEKAEFTGTIIDINDESANNFERTNMENTCTSEDMAYVIYTSGSTGKPKGVVLGHKSVINFITGMSKVINFLPGKTIINLTTISFDIFVLETILPLIKGLKVVIADEEQQKDPKLIQEAVLSKNVNMLQVTPSRLAMLLNNMSSNNYLVNLKEILIGGEVLTENLLKKLKSFTKARIYNLYGPTETTVWSTVKELTESSVMNIGKPISNTRIYILDKNNCLTPVGTVGELCISGDGLAKGYYNNPELTAERFTVDPFHEEERMYRTGDYARWLENGDIQFVGRKDGQVKIRGFRIESGEIETCILKYKGLNEAVVIAKGDNFNKHLCAFFIADRKLLAKDLREFLLRELPEYMIPSYFIQLDKLPLTPNGKVDRRALYKMEMEIDTGVDYMAPRNEIEERLAGIWEEALNIKKPSINDNFFNLGGNSLEALSIISEIHKNFDLEIKLSRFFEKPTIALISQIIKEEEELQNIIEGCINEI